MSLPSYSAELRPEPALRALTLVSGSGLGILGGIVIVLMPLPLPVRGLLLVAWCAEGIRELAGLSSAYRQVRCLRLYSDGRVQFAGYGGEWLPGTLEAGSIVLAGCAWLRVRAADGRRHAELVAGNCRKNNDWRRLQVIWRHLGAPP